MINKLLQQAQQHINHGNFANAEPLLQQILQADPKHPEAHLLLGLLSSQHGDLPAAIQHMQAVLAAKPAHADAACNVGILYSKQGQHNQAVHYLRHAIACRPGFAEAHNNLGHVLMQLDQIDEAIEHFRQSVLITPRHALGLYNLGYALFRKGDYQQAETYFLQAIEQNPLYADAYSSLGLTLQRLKNIPAAIHAFEQAITIAPNNISYYLNLGNLYYSKNHYSQAESWYNKAMTINPHHIGLLYNLGNLYRTQERYAKAEQAYTGAITIDPSLTAAWTNLGLTCQALGQPEKALIAYNKSLQLQPDPEIYGNRAQALLLSGNLETGFAEYEWRTKIAKYKPGFDWCPHIPRWQGEIFSGKRLLVHDEQGFGDALQFVRYLPLVKARGGIVLLSTKKQLLTLLENSPGIDIILEHTEEALGKTSFDLVIPLLSLPHILGTTLKTIPNTIPYLFPPTGSVASWQSYVKSTAAPSCLKVGLVWAGNPKNTQGSIRTCGLHAYAPLAKVPNIIFYSLQKGEAAQESLHPPTGMRIIDCSDKITDFADTAALIKNLDLVITIDTAVAHLAGGLGVPTWTILPFANEWRWLVGRADTPWYRTMRLFRQDRPQNWTTVMLQVADELLTLWKAHSSGI